YRLGRFSHLRQFELWLLDDLRRRRNIEFRHIRSLGQQILRQRQRRPSHLHDVRQRHKLLQHFGFLGGGMQNRLVLVRRIRRIGKNRLRPRKRHSLAAARRRWRRRRLVRRSRRTSRVSVPFL